MYYHYSALGCVTGEHKACRPSEFNLATTCSCFVIWKNARHA